MSDPTPTPTTTPAVTARSARETIKAHVEACERWAGGPEGLQHEATAPTSGYISAMMRTALPLRALLDAPTSAVERLVKAARDIDETLRADAMPNDAAHLALVDALAAVRASPEGVGVANVDLVHAERDIVALKKERAAHEKTKFALEATQRDLAAARGEVERVTAAWLGLQREARRLVMSNRCVVLRVRLNEDDDDSPTVSVDCEEVAAVKRLVDVPVRERPSTLPPTSAPPWCERLRAEAERSATPPPASEAPKFTDGSTGLRLTEAPISERARLVYEGAVRFAVRDPRDTPEVCARIAASVLAASERAAKAPAPAEG